jgi:hypothetical protein
MVRRTRRALGIRFAIIALVTVGLTAAERSARGQSELGRGSGGSVPYPYGANGGRATGPGNPATRSGPGAAMTPGLYANPYAVPTMNPFLNPYAAIYADASPTNAALYFFAAQQSMGGIGSGQISGVRPRPSAAPAPSSAPAPSDRRVSDTPGSGAARYFNRGFRGGATPQGHYNRFGNYYSGNGH